MSGCSVTSVSQIWLGLWANKLLFTRSLLVGTFTRFFFTHYLGQSGFLLWFKWSAQRARRTTCTSFNQRSSIGHPFEHRAMNSPRASTKPRLESANYCESGWLCSRWYRSHLRGKCWQARPIEWVLWRGALTFSEGEEIL